MKDLYDFATRFGGPVVKDGCGVFGAVRKEGSNPIPGRVAVDGISCVKYRGSSLGAGYVAFFTSNGSGGRTSDPPPYLIQAFVKSETVAERLAGRFREIGEIEGSTFTSVQPRTAMSRWEAKLRPSRGGGDGLVEATVDSINLSLADNGFEGRIFSFGRYLRVYKDLGYPQDVARKWGLDDGQVQADMWLAHTRQPTNSPGSLPVWSHPFASMNAAVVHNGDISSFGANMELLNSWKLRSHVGTDSEVVARLLDRLVRVEGLGIREAATVLTNPFERNASRETLELLRRYRGARLDGPFAVVAGYADGGDIYLIALADRSKFRPLLIGEDESNFYVASEENQIRHLSEQARVWAPQPGSFFIASLRHGIIEPGTDRGTRKQSHAFFQEPGKAAGPSYRMMDASGLGFREINEAISSSLAGGDEGIQLENCSGQRYLGIGVSTKGREDREFTIRLTGFPGNCLANLNEGATFEVFGNAADDLADTMHAGSVTVHGDARDVVAQAMQGGSIFVRGSVGNRAAIQMREYSNRRPFLVVGETAEDYLGEYMAGGVVVILNLSNSPRPVGNYVGTGMVGGRIYIRGRVDDSQIGLLPNREDVLSYVRACSLDGIVTKEAYEELAGASYPTVELLSKYLPPDVFSRIVFLFFSSKYTKHPLVERRSLSEKDDLLLGDTLKKFFESFSLPAELMAEAMTSEFTVLRAKDEKEEMRVPPQEAPVEE